MRFMDAVFFLAVFLIKMSKGHFVLSKTLPTLSERFLFYAFFDCETQLYRSFPRAGE